MELQNFPYDMQELSIELALNCRINGILGCELCVAPDAQISVSNDGFACHQLYDLDERTTYCQKLTGDGYPTIRVSARVYRHPFYIVINMMLPMFCFVLMSMCQYIVPTNDQEVRLAVTLTLVLTASAYKLVTSSTVPDIAYLTIADKYVLACFYLMVILVCEAAVVGCITYTHSRGILRDHVSTVKEVSPFFFFDLPSTPLLMIDDRTPVPEIFNGPALVDCIFFGVSMAAFVLIHLWVIVHIINIDRQKRKVVGAGVMVNFGAHTKTFARMQEATIVMPPSRAPSNAASTRHSSSAPSLRELSGRQPQPQASGKLNRISPGEADGADGDPPADAPGAEAVK